MPDAVYAAATRLRKRHAWENETMTQSRQKIITADSESVRHLINADDKFIVLYRLVGEMAYKTNYDPYGAIIETIVGQMLSNKVAHVLFDRLKKTCPGGKIDAESIGKLSLEQLRSTGISWSKARCILEFTDEYNKNDYTRRTLSLLSDDEIIKRITAIRGLGNWSAKMFLLFVMDRENILPHEDMAFLQAFAWYNGLQSVPKTNEIKKICEKWEPYRSTAARYLYKALDNGLTKKAFDSYNFEL
jgi:DNA-3-methyladenine glycosylase II